VSLYAFFAALLLVSSFTYVLLNRAGLNAGWRIMLMVFIVPGIVCAWVWNVATDALDYFAVLYAVIFSIIFSILIEALRVIKRRSWP